jgi:hypothetical protein
VCECEACRISIDLLLVDCFLKSYKHKARTQVHAHKKTTTTFLLTHDRVVMFGWGGGGGWEEKRRGTARRRRARSPSHVGDRAGPASCSAGVCGKAGD